MSSPPRARAGASADRVAVTVSVVAGLLTACWVTAAVMMAGRGLDVTDESLYLLSYRWWNVDVRAFSGVQYVYGPVFDLLGHSVGGLRIFRLVTVVAAHATFGWSFMTWLRTQRPEAHPSRRWELAGTLTILASGGITYGWLPLSPGYNDVAMLGTLLVAAVVLRCLRAVHLGRRLPVLPAVGLGPLVVVVVLAKWSSAAAALALLGAMAVLALRLDRASGWWRFVGITVASVVASAAFVNFALMSFRTMLPPMLEVNRLVAKGSNSPTALLRYYVREGLILTGHASAIAAVAVVVAAVGYAVVRRGYVGAGSVTVVLGPPAALVATSPGTGGVPEGGVDRLPEYSAVLVGLSLAVCAAYVVHRVVRHRRERPEARRLRPRSEWFVVAMLLLLPPVQALGSGNPLQFLAVNQYAAWVALLVGAVTSLPARSPLALFGWSAAACAVVASVAVGVGGLLVHPYRASSFADSTTRIGGDGTGSSLRVSPAEAAFYARLRSVVGSAATPGRPMMGFDGKSGFILVLGGRSVGEAWYAEPYRSAAGIRWACADGNPWAADRQPIIMYSRRPVPADRGALQSCGLALRSDYDAAGAVEGVFPRLMVYLPRSGAAPTKP